MQLSYAIGYPDPLNIWVNTNGTAARGLADTDIAELIRKHFKLTPHGIIETLNLRRPIYRETARHGHFGRELARSPGRRPTRPPHSGAVEKAA